MKKCILLFLLILFTYDGMFGSKSGICVPPSSQEKYKEKINEIFDDVTRWGIIFYNFIPTCEECQQKIIKEECTSMDIFYDIWQLCLDKEKPLSEKSACEVKRIVYTYILDKIDILKKNFELQVWQYYKQEIGQNKYAMNDFFSCEGLKKSFIVSEIVDAQEEDDDRADIGLIRDLLEETEQIYKKICACQNYIEKFYKNFTCPNETNEEIFEIEGIFNEKTTNIPFLQKKIKQALINIFDDKNRQENQMLEEIDGSNKKILSQKSPIKKQKKIEGRSCQTIEKPEYLLDFNNFESINKPIIENNNNTEEPPDFSDNLLDGISGVKEIISFKETIIKK